MKIFIKRPSIQGAWMWITKGYARAWESLGFEVVYYDLIEEIPTDGEYDLMARDWDLINMKGLAPIEAARRTYFIAQPNEFPLPWGAHPNFHSHCSDEIIDRINKLDNVYLWSFGSTSPYHTKWKKVNSMPLAFDSISYNMTYAPEHDFDVCFVGGWANNGFDEKRKIMLEYFGHYKDSGMKCGFFINKNLTHEQENSILCSSKVAINIHDAYQHALGLDTNERTFKTLGTTGILVSDNVEQIKDLDLRAVMTESPKEMVEAVRKYVFDTSREEREEIKIKNRANILQEHTYIIRAKKMMELK